MRSGHKKVTWSWFFVLCLPMFLVALTGCPLAASQTSSLDADGDGVAGGEDVCPGTPADAEVDDAGCALSQLDSDSDGVTDDLDACADTPTTVNTDEAGCPVSEPGTPDADGDGVPDDIDQCPDTPADESVDPNGCTEAQLDADGDGVRNDIDQCADTPTTVPVDEVGCPVSQPGTPDSDDDGVPDDIDQCADTPSGETVDPNGCTEAQVDADGDGVRNGVDQCENTPTTVPVDELGCPVSEPGALDADDDGVPDDIDQCADTPIGESVDPNGCSDSQQFDDTDGDGVNDDVDQCDETPAGADVDENGCAATQRDSDGDGVNDALDQCPNTPPDTSVDNTTGCETTPPDVPTPGETDQSWNVTDDELFVGVLEPRSYDVAASGLLTQARVTLSDELVADPDTTVVTETVPLSVSTTLATAVIDDAVNGPLPITFMVLFDQFAVDYDSDGSVCPAGGVCWQFDIKITTEVDLSGAPSVSSARYKGVMTGTLSGDGKTITWSVISGTRTVSLGNGAVETTVDALEHAFAGVSFGSWVLVE